MEDVRVEASSELEDWVNAALEREDGEIVVPSKLAIVRVASVVAQQPDVIYVSVPEEMDAVERVLIDVARRLGTNALSEVDAALKAGETKRAIDAIESARGRYRVLVGEVDALLASVASELSAMVANQATFVRNWLLGQRRLTVDTSPSWPKQAVRVANGHPVAFLPFGADVSYAKQELAATYTALNGVRSPPPEGSLRAAIFESLTTEQRDVAVLLACHARVVTTVVSRALRRHDELALLARVGVAKRVSDDGYLIDPDWRDHLVKDMGDRQRREAHKTLAVVYAELAGTEPSARGASYVIEAHRHFAEAGDTTRALELAPYGQHLLVATARRLSIEEQWSEAAALYSEIARHAQGGRVRGYARHYEHFNRARAKSESLSATIAGYAKSLEDWPENALYWSRQIRALVYAGDVQKACLLLRKALATVPVYPGREAVLIARTVDRLLSTDRHVEAAVLIWGSYEPTTTIGREVQTKLERALGRGFDTSRIVASDAGLHFHRDERVRVTKVAGGWVAALDRLSVQGSRCPTAADALAKLSQELRARTLQLMRMFAHEATEADIAVKRLFLSTVDVIASEIAVRRRSHAWVIGTLTGEPGCWVVEYGAERYEVPDAVREATGALVDGLCLARVVCERSIPRGPATELMALVNSNGDEIWDELARRKRESAHEIDGA